MGSVLHCTIVLAATPRGAENAREGAAEAHTGVRKILSMHVADFLNPWRAPFEPWPAGGAGASLEGCWQTLHACALGAKKAFSDQGHGPARWISHPQKRFAGFFGTFPRPARSLSNPPKLLRGFLWTHASAALGSFRAPHACAGPAKHPLNSNLGRLRLPGGLTSRHSTPDAHTAPEEPSIHTG